MNDIKTIDPDTLKITSIDAILYPLEVIEAAAVSLNPFASFKIELTGNKYLIEMKIFNDSVLTIEDIDHNFQNNIIHESLRRKIYQQTDMERNLILAYTFSNTKMMG